MSALSFLTALSGLAGISLVCFGEFFSMNFHHSDVKSVWLGFSPLILGTTMCLASILGAAGLSSPDASCRWSLVVSVKMAVPFSIAAFLSFLSFLVQRRNILRLVREHNHPLPPPGGDSDPDEFQWWYDTFLWFCISLTVLEVLRHRLGKRRLHVMVGQGCMGGPQTRRRSLLEDGWEDENIGSMWGEAQLDQTLSDHLTSQLLHPYAWQPQTCHTHLFFSIFCDFFVLKQLLQRGHCEELRRAYKDKNMCLMDKTRGSSGSAWNTSQ